MEDCIFCKINEKKIPATIIFENEEILAFRDISPQAPSHILIIPKVHINNLNELEDKHGELMGKLILQAKNIAKQENLDEKGYRLVLNCKEDGGQTVDHIHIHLLGGRGMSWPPG